MYLYPADVCGSMTKFFASGRMFEISHLLASFNSSLSSYVPRDEEARRVMMLSVFGSPYVPVWLLGREKFVREGLYPEAVPSFEEWVLYRMHFFLMTRGWKEQPQEGYNLWRVTPAWVHVYHSSWRPDSFYDQAAWQGAIRGVVVDAVEGVLHIVPIPMSFPVTERELDIAMSALDRGLGKEKRKKDLRLEAREAGRRAARAGVAAREAKVRAARAFRMVELLGDLSDYDGSRPTMFVQRAVPPEVGGVVADGFSAATRLEALAASASSILGVAGSGWVGNRAVKAILAVVVSTLDLPEEEAKELQAAVGAVHPAAVRGLVSASSSLIWDCVARKSLEPLSEPAPLSIVGLAASLHAIMDAHAFLGPVKAKEMSKRAYKRMAFEYERAAKSGLFLDSQTLTSYVSADSRYGMFIVSLANSTANMKPTIVFIDGPGSSGKSWLADLLATELLRTMFGADYVVEMGVARPNKKDKFDSELNPNKVCIMHDDPLPMRGKGDLKDERHAVFGEMIYDTAAGKPITLNKAALNEKGIQQCFPRLMTVTSNMPMAGMYPEDFRDVGSVVGRIVGVHLCFQDESKNEAAKVSREKEYLKDKRVPYKEFFDDKVLYVGAFTDGGNNQWTFTKTEAWFGAAKIREWIKAFSEFQARRLTDPSGFSGSHEICRECYNGPHTCVCGAKVVVPTMTIEQLGDMHRAKVVAADADVVVVGGAEVVALITSACQMVAETMSGTLAPGVSAIVAASAVPFVLPWLLFYHPLSLFAFLFADFCGHLVGTTGKGQGVWGVHRVNVWITRGIVEVRSVFAMFELTWVVRALSFVIYCRATCYPVIERTRIVAALVDKGGARVGVFFFLTMLVMYWVTKRRSRVATVVSTMRVDLDTVAVDDHAERPVEVMVHTVDDYRSLEEKDLGSIGLPMTVMLGKRVSPAHLPPILFGSKARTSTWKTFLRTLLQRGVLCRSDFEAETGGYFQGVLVLPGVLATVTHGVANPRGVPSTLLCRFRGEDVAVSVHLPAGRVMDHDGNYAYQLQNTGKCFGNSYIEFDTLFVAVPSRSSMSAEGYLLEDYEPSQMLGLKGVVVDVKGARLIDATIVATNPMKIDVEVPGGVSGAQFWAPIDDKPICLALVSMSTVGAVAGGKTPFSILTPVTRRAALKCPGSVYAGVVSTCAPVLPERFTYSTTINEDDMAFYSPVHGSVVAVATNAVKSELKWQAFPVEGPPLAPALWAVRGFHGFVVDPEAKTGLPVVGTALGQPVVYVDDFSVTRVALAAKQVVPSIARGLMEQAVNHQVLFLAEGVSGVDIGMCSIEEACFGGDTFDGVNSQSSAGPTLGGKVRDYIDKASRVIAPVLRTGVAWWLSRWKQGVAPEPVVKAQIKQETRLMTKYLPRNVFVVDLSLNIALKMVFGRLVNAIGAAGYRNGLLFKANAASKAFSQFFEPMHSVHVDVLDSDMDMFDWRQNSLTQAYVTLVTCDLLISLGASVEHVLMARSALCGLGNALMFLGLVVYYLRMGLITGVYLTTFKNSLLVQGLMFMSMVLSAARVKKTLSFRHIKACVRMGIVGDDNTSMFTKEFVRFYDYSPAVLKAVCEACGLVVKSSNKGELSVAFMEKKGIRFLKRLLDLVVDGPRKGRIQASLPLDSITKSMVVIDASKPVLPVAVGSTLVNAWKETLLLEEVLGRALRGKLEVYRENFALKFGYSLDVMSEQMFQEKYDAGEFSTFDSC
jgi:hypothetical protein